VSLAAAQAALAEHLDDNLDCRVTAEVPGAPVAGAGYVWPADDWVTMPDEGAFCGRSVGLRVDVCASTANMIRATAWLAERVDEIWVSCAGGVDIPGAEPIVPLRTERPVIVRPVEGGELLVARTEFTRFTLEDS
jgi:hypothetical protein